MNIIVCIKQVPDTTEVKINPQTGTLIREGVPSIMNPDDKGGLEFALQLKDQYGAHVTVITMGLPQADAILREALAMGVDRAILLTDRKLGGADSLATSSSLAGALRTMDYDLIVTGRQAIDGDTAQVGPQVAEKLGLPQVTYAEEIMKIENSKITIRRGIAGGVETVEAPMPLLITVNGSAAECRPRNAKLAQKYKRALGVQEKAEITKAGQPLPYEDDYKQYPYLNIEEWSVADVDADVVQCGLSGSPTKVKTIQNIVFQAKESKVISSADGEIDDLMKELIENHTIG